MIQRYELYDDHLEGSPIGEWVKWEDIKEVMGMTLEIDKLKSSDVDLLIINPKSYTRPYPLQYFVDLARGTLDFLGVGSY